MVFIGDNNNIKPKKEQENPIKPQRNGRDSGAQRQAKVYSAANHLPSILHKNKKDRPRTYTGKRRKPNPYSSVSR